MNFRQMRAFISVYEEGSFSAAAVRENATQSGLSMQIRNLEERLGVRLFERGPQGVAATPAGRIYYARCLPILNAAQMAEEEVQALAGDIYGKLRVGVIPSLSRSGLAQVLVTTPSASVTSTSTSSNAPAKPSRRPSWPANWISPWCRSTPRNSASNRG